ncbi:MULTISPECIES: hypothetical protein [unclassified Bradyrhizobium]|uniref:hypothetical protein n=1 Tax=unclassified Bradyrhizobium TaxID=2631580 RepID=UPI0028F01CF2|nr:MULTISPECIES: hypothetical protein [unclassified Bradyrhizobium]
MSLDRREFLTAVSALTMTPVSLSHAASETSLAMASSQVVSLRSVLNIGFASGGNEYRFIDHFRIAEQFGPVGNAWSKGATWTQVVAADGYPKVSLRPSDNRGFGGGVRIPASFQYGEVGSGQFYVLRWKGNGVVRLMLQSGAWTFYSSRSRNVTPVSPDAWQTTFGSDSYVVLSFTGPAQLFSVVIQATDPNGVGARLHGVQFYRLTDEADLQAGKVFRTPYKKSIVDLCPSAIRFMDWVGGNNSKLTRFETRTLPSYAAYEGQANWVASPPYGETTGTNQYALAAVKGMPAQLLHGEIVTCRIGSSMVRAGGKKVKSVSNSNPGFVTAPEHGFATDDVVVHQLSQGVMPKLHLRPCRITVIDRDRYAIDVDTTGFGSFSGNASVNQFIMLDVGGRGAYPVTFPVPQAMASQFGNDYIKAGDYKTFIFDKSIAARTDGQGHYVYGVWMFNDAGANNGHAGGVPLEICTALVNEVNALQPVHPIHMWLNIPHLGLCSMDPDYAPASNWGIQAVKTVLNGANGFAGLTSGVDLFLEYSNETWNSGGPAFSQTYYCAYRGLLRWPTSGEADYASMATLRSVVNVEDIKTAMSNSHRLRFVLAGQGTVGVSGVNAARIEGTKFFLADPMNIWGARVPPMAHHDLFAFAGYFVANQAFDAANLDSLTKAWVNSIGDPAAQEVVCAAYVRGLVDPSVGGGETTDRYGRALLPAYVNKMKSLGKSVIMYEGGWDHDIRPVSAAGLVTGTLPFASGLIDGETNVITGVNPTYAAALAPGSFILGHGIASNTTVTSVDGGLIELSQRTLLKLNPTQFVAFSSQQAFLLAVKRSRAWASALLAYFDQFGGGSGMPSIYVQNGLRWGHCFPSAYGLGSSEWSDLDVAWQQIADRNRRVV